MKRILLSLAILVCAASTQAQVTFEKRYNGFVQFTKLSDGSVKYYQPYLRGAALRIYNQDHSIFRTITVPAVPGVTASRVDAVSDKLMNQDNALEYVAVYNDPNAASGQETDKMRIWTESGTQLLAADTLEYASFYNTPAGTKMLAVGYALNTATNTSIEVSRIYGVGGTYTPLRTQNAAESATAQPFPNPSTEQIQLPYTVGSREVATLRVMDMAGRVVRTFQVDNHSDHLLLRTDKLASGVYTYTVQSAAGVSSGRRFVVQN